MADVKKEVESLLFSSGRAMAEKDLADIIGVKLKDVQKAIEDLKKDYDTRDTSLSLMQTAEGWKLNVKERYVNLVTKIVADTELPFPLLETLSVIAYKAPAWQAEVIKARGTNAYEHIQALIDAGFIERRKKGRSFELGLTQKFFDYFDVPGEQKLRMLFKDVKPSEPKKRIGKLEVIDVEGNQTTLPKNPIFSDSAKPGQAPTPGKLGELDVVEVAQPKNNQFQPDNQFLQDIDSKIGELSKRNDELDQDDLFKKEDAVQNTEPEAEPGEDSRTPAGDNSEYSPPENRKSKEIFGESHDKSQNHEDKADEHASSDKDEDEYKTKDPLDEEKELEI
jgi:segregation and condensation protein B